MLRNNVHVCLFIMLLSLSFSLIAAEGILNVVLGSASWLEATARCRETNDLKRACRWVMNSTDDAPANYPFLSTSLYYGSAGPAIFLSQLVDSDAVSSKLKWEALAHAALEDVRDSVDSAILNYGINSGFYYGLSGIAWGLREVGAVLPNPDIYLQAARHIERHILSNVRPFSENGDAQLWNNTDIAHGASGTGLAFLRSSNQELNSSHAKALRAGAIEAGKWLVKQAEPNGDGLRWWRGPDTDGSHVGDYFPTFCCGTAGVAYFLAELSLADGVDHELQREFLEAALKGGRHVLSVSVKPVNGTMLVPHGEQGSDLTEYYLGWCGGAPGWGRLFVKLWQATHERIWLDSLVSAVKGTEAFVLPNLTMMLPVAKQGDWQNLGQCCGAAAAGNFLLQFSLSDLPLHADVMGEAQNSARRIAEAIASHAKQEEAGYVLPSAEEHAKPFDVRSQAGWMQGASGVASFLLHMHAVDTGDHTGVRKLWPDEPWHGRQHLDLQHHQTVVV
eukprot:TRINITY_DN29765_c0_g1_i1.p1 TRINITY_DN29765_c0_g1~~TRINITY_DN29765_c0_g1_i1.p1  ORF type:complete len:504 (-),score=62.96 TRINITY_DN29765_c0_g1_i1:105-1616(-)